MGAVQQESFGALLRRYRKSAGLTQEELAERAELSVRQLSYLEGGKHAPHAGTLRRLANALALAEQDRSLFSKAAQAREDGSSRDPEWHLSSLPALREGSFQPHLPPFGIASRAGTNLPAQPTRFIGREREIVAIGDLLRQEEVHLLTLTGPGGTGKTRLAIQVAQDLLHAFPDGAYFVPLAPLTDPALVLSAIATTLEISEEGGKPLLETLKKSLQEAQLLLVLDNFEHLLKAAPEVAELLAVCPAMKVLVTSRSVLHLAAEHDYAVPPLAVPDHNGDHNLGGLVQYDAVALLVQQARAAKATFALTQENAGAVVEICRRLDGLPLAIGLAAARVRLFPPRALVARLEKRLPLLTGGARDLPARQQTLRATIAWSYDLLDEPEKWLFARLSVFAGGWTLEAAEAVCDPDGELGARVLDGMASLVEQSLVQEEGEEEPRFVMLETLREYAIERLEDRGETQQLRQRHAEYFRDFTRDADGQLMGLHVSVWLRRLDHEHDNLRQALRWSLEHTQAQLALNIATNIWRYWEAQGHLSEGRRWLEEALAQDEVDTEMRVTGLLRAGRLAVHQGGYEEARSLFEEALSRALHLGYDWAVPVCLRNLGLVAASQADYRRAISLLEQALNLNHELEGDPVSRKRNEALTLEMLGDVWRAQSEYPRARKHYEDSLALLRDLKHDLTCAELLVKLGGVATAIGEYEEATNLHTQGVRLSRHLGNKRVLCSALNDLGAIAAATGKPEQAARLWAAANTLRAQLGLPGGRLGFARYEALEARAQAELGTERWNAARAAGRAMSLEHAVEYALDGKGVGEPYPS